MPDPIRLKEIHAALDAGKYGDGRTANLAVHIAEIAKILGNTLIRTATRFPLTSVICAGRRTTPRRLSLRAMGPGAV